MNKTELLEMIQDTSNTQDIIAYAYQDSFGSIQPDEWPEINTAIKKRWPSKSGLARVKIKAWKIYKSRGSRGN